VKRIIARDAEHLPVTRKALEIVAFRDNVLIALIARAIGATVITRTRIHFEWIRDVRGVRPC
jgi:hypothetical protein